MFFSSMMSHTANGYFRWYLNNSTVVSAIYVGNNNYYQSGSGMVTLELAVGDTVYLKSLGSSKDVHRFSCYTRIKIK